MTRNGNIPSFRIGDAFPSEDKKRVSLVRFLISAQSLPAITRVIPLLPESAAFHESKHYLNLLSLGAAYEAASAFWGALQNGLFEPLSALDFGGIDQCVSRLTVQCDPDRSDSLLSKLVRCRHKFSFHRDMKEVRRSLAQVEDEELPAWAGGSNFMTNSIPIVECVTWKGLQIVTGSDKELQDLMERVPLFTVDLARVAEAAYAVALEAALKRRSGES
jgi:hypothetical protein